MLRALAVSLVLAGCVDLDEPHRVLISDSATNVTDMAASEVYADLANFSTAKYLTGTPDAFAVSGAVHNPWDGSATGSFTGSGGKVGDVLDLHLAITVAGWDDVLWSTQLDGTITFDQHADYSNPDLPPGTASTEIAAHLHMTQSFDGTHEIKIVVCNRWVGDNPLYGYHGVVDGDPVSDHYEGNDPACNVTP
jgi:hypothetical protein